MPHRPGWVGCEDRIAWLLRASRLYGQDERLANMAAFAAAFAGGCWSGPVSGSQISRWETAASRAGYLVLRRYEQVLELPEGHLVAVADWIYRQAVGTAGPPRLDRGLDPTSHAVHERTEQLLDKALSTDLMRGVDWDELTSHLAVLHTAFVYPSTLWAELAERLLGELVIANGPSWLPRNEAFKRLMGHPRASSAVIAACAAMVADPTNEAAIEPLAVLDKSPHPQANRSVLAQLTNPTKDRAQRGALLAAIDKVAHRHFTPDQLGRILTVVTDLLTEPHLHTDARQLATEVLRCAPTDRARLRRVIASDLLTEHILAWGQTVTPDAAGHVTERVTASVTSRMIGDSRSGPDPMLSTLIGELLFSPNLDVRLSAGQLLGASPYREPTGAALGAELGPVLMTRAVPVATAIVDALPFVGSTADRSMAERLILAPGVPAPMVDDIAWKIGHLPGRSSQRFWVAAIDRYSRHWQRDHSALSTAVLRGLVYGLGIEQRQALLTRMRSSATLPPPARAAAAWWQAIPSHIRASAAL